MKTSDDNRTQDPNLRFPSNVGEDLSEERWASLSGVFHRAMSKAGEVKAAKLKADEEQERRNENRIVPSLLEWGRHFLPEHLSRPPSKMHRWIDERFHNLHQERGTKINILGPRGAAKSTLASLAYPLLAALEEWEPYIWIVSDTSDQARTHLKNIKMELADNQQIQNGYPLAAGEGPTWRSQKIVLRNGVVIEAFGAGQKLRGRRSGAHRPSLILCDDLQNDTHAVSATARDRSRDWFQGALMKAGDKRTNVVNLATALHRDALAMELCEKPGWESEIFRAILQWPRNMSLWEEWERIYSDVSEPDSQTKALEFYESRKGELNADAEVLWPEEEDLYTLMCMRAEGGRTAFEREKQNEPINPDLCEWPESYFDESIWFDEPPRDVLIKTLALDPSKGSDARRGDYSAFVQLTVDRRGILYVEADMERRPVEKIVDDGVALCEAFRPDAFGVESNQFQELLGEDLAEALDSSKCVGLRPYPILNRVNKQVRIRRLGPLLSSRRLRFREGSASTRLLVEQLKDFPIGSHDDGPDALEMAIRLAEQYLSETSGPSDKFGGRFEC